MLVQVNLETLPLRPRIDLARFADVADTLLHLAKDPHSDVRLALIGNKHVSDSIVIELSQDENEAVRNAELAYLNP